MHAELEALLQYVDGQLAEAEKRNLEKHLAKCAECRREVEFLRQAADPEVSVTTPTADEVVAGARHWAEERQLHGVNPEVVKWRVASVISPFLGWSATGSVLGGVAADGNNLLAVIEPVLAVFLGRGAAKHLVSHVVDAAIVRI